MRLIRFVIGFLAASAGVGAAFVGIYEYLEYCHPPLLPLFVGGIGLFIGCNHMVRAVGVVDE